MYFTTIKEIFSEKVRETELEQLLCGKCSSSPLRIVCSAKMALRLDAGSTEAEPHLDKVYVTALSDEYAWLKLPPGTSCKVLDKMYKDALTASIYRHR